MELGNVANQSFAGANYNMSSSPVIYLGNGDYSALLNQNSYYLATDGFGNFTTYGIWFGTYVQGVNSYAELKYESNTAITDTPLTTIFASNFQGLGLPAYEYATFVNLMSRISENITTSLVRNDRIITIKESCSSSNLTSLWNYTLNF